MADSAAARIELAEQWSAMRERRRRHFPDDLFDETAWDILLALYIAEGRGDVAPADRILASINVNPATSGRWVAHLAKEGQVERSGDTLTLSDTAREAMEKLLDEYAEDPSS